MRNVRNIFFVEISFKLTRSNLKAILAADNIKQLKSELTRFRTLLKSSKEKDDDENQQLIVQIKEKIRFLRLQKSMR